MTLTVNPKYPDKPDCVCACMISSKHPEKYSGKCIGYLDDKKVTIDCRTSVIWVTSNKCLNCKQYLMYGEGETNE